jgi:thiamine pyrophosphokinase
MTGNNRNNVVILANGQFPLGERCRGILREASMVICCDGAADKLLDFGMEPDVIVGDMDSISEGARQRYRNIMIRSGDPDSNDLTKAVRYCMERDIRAADILGATGMREDHTLGNISLMLQYFPGLETRICSDHGMFFLVRSGERIGSFRGEQISMFSIDNRVRVTASGLRYPVDELQLALWCTASLNESTGDHFTLRFESDLPLIVFRAW